MFNIPRKGTKVSKKPIIDMTEIDHKFKKLLKTIQNT